MYPGQKISKNFRSTNITPKNSLVISIGNFENNLASTSTMLCGQVIIIVIIRQCIEKTEGPIPEMQQEVGHGQIPRLVHWRQRNPIAPMNRVGQHPVAKFFAHAIYCPWNMASNFNGSSWRHTEHTYKDSYLIFIFNIHFKSTIMHKTCSKTLKHAFRSNTSALSSNWLAALIVNYWPWNTYTRVIGHRRVFFFPSSRSFSSLNYCPDFRQCHQTNTHSWCFYAVLNKVWWGHHALCQVDVQNL